MEDVIVKQRLLGKGTYGKVYMAVFRDGGLLLAVKSSAFTRSSFVLREKTSSSLSDCPDVVQCFGGYASIEVDGYLVYNLLLERGGKLSEPEVRHYARMIVRGLCHMHERGLTHCDLKPDNVLVFPGKDGGNVVKIADFGMARRDGEQEVLESLAFEEYEAPMDVWSLGCTVVELVTGQRPWNRCKGVNEIVEHVVVKSEVPNIPKHLSEKDPRRRWTAEKLMNHSFVAPIHTQMVMNDLLSSRCYHPHRPQACLLWWSVLLLHRFQLLVWFLLHGIPFLPGCILFLQYFQIFHFLPDASFCSSSMAVILINNCYRFHVYAKLLIET
ncbi:hypothetical protein AAG906_021169 [Vitis piasezkii]